MTFPHLDAYNDEPEEEEAEQVQPSWTEEDVQALARLYRRYGLERMLGYIYEGIADFVLHGDPLFERDEDEAREDRTSISRWLRDDH
jgi:hypothetical protein